MKIIHSGFDTISFAVQGALSEQSLAHLAEIKEIAVTEERAVPVCLGYCKVPMNLNNQGQKGGYAYVLTTGEFGAVFSFKSNVDRKGWNGFVKIRSQNLARFGWRKSITEALEVLRDIGFFTLSISMNRVDYCMDVLNMGIELNPSDFIAHARVTKNTRYQTEKTSLQIDKQSISRSDRVVSITLGKMPGRQVITYDKRAEAIAKRKPFWFALWGINRADITQTVHRVELRAGKKELEKYRIKSLVDFEKSIGDVFNKIVRAIRYVIPSDNDTNVSRYPNHPLWDMISEHVNSQLLAHTSRIDPETILEVIREEKANEYMQNIIGNAAGFSVCSRIDFGSISEKVPVLLKEALESAISNNPEKFSRTYTRAKDRLRFISPS